MYGELRSPNVHEPKNLNEYATILMNYRDGTTSLWAGGTYIMSQKDYYPSNNPNVEIISLNKIEELHHFLRNDRFTSFGSMVTLNSIAETGKLVLPAMLLEAIDQTACEFVRDRITIGGALSTPSFRTAIASVLTILDASIEIRYPYKKHMHSKWLHLSKAYDKNGNLTVPDNSLITNVRIALTQPDFQYFYTTGNPMINPESGLTVAALAKLDNYTISSSQLIITLPQLGFCLSRDIDNLLSSLSLPVDKSRCQSFETFVLSYIAENVGQITKIQEAKIRGILEHMISQLNTKVLSSRT